MLRAAWRALSSSRTLAVTQTPILRLSDRGRARLPSNQRGLQPRGLLLQAARGFAIQKPEQTDLQEDPSPDTLLKDYQNIPGIEKVDDVVRRLLSLEMANQKEKLEVKKELMMKKIVANPEDTSSLEARIVALTVKIHSYEKHMQKHRKDKAHKRYLLMSIDQRKKMLTNLRSTNYDVFEKTCQGLGIEYTIPPLYNQKTHRRWVTKKALCIRVYQEAQKLKKQKRALKSAAAIAQKQGPRSSEGPSEARPEALLETQ
ncbi:PREDICTED: 28S ribosomal protein S15, mitochondrial [Chrysochloris asiatica]|uniref:Small ribosomal subunit protein uS15m n=1 Tax=Chrysochloris asiatica TaxID=185453 RepID=A0A9B0TVS4_CHRAS|nr:PREDICTED: 28S ribosomal protein S15, mitochondrial [Chrysochloris asiatica]